MNSLPPAPDSVPLVIERLELTRKALKKRPSEFADAAGVARSTYSNWKNGKGRPELTQALKLCAVYGLTLDWIYRGIMEGLPARVWDAITSYKEISPSPSVPMANRPFRKRG